MLKVPTSLTDQTLAESGIGARTGLNVIAIQRGDELTTNPPAAARLPSGGELIVIGTSEQRMEFARVFGDSHA